eukprot:9514723-Alexandrium_andersonii.AAC.1
MHPGQPAHLSTTAQPQSRQQQQPQQLLMNVSVFDRWALEGLRSGEGSFRMQWESLSFVSDSEE